MSGTSLDGIDAVLADFGGPRPHVLGHCSVGLPPALKADLLALNTPGDNELHRAALAANAMVRLYASQVDTLLSQCGLQPSAVRAMGAHGQTVRHRPQEFDGSGYTMQLNNPALLAELCGIAVVADFQQPRCGSWWPRRAAGAALSPSRLWTTWGPTLAVLNIGGISNITILDQTAVELLGFDCGPGNALMDGWCQTHTGQGFDDGGQWAARGRFRPGHCWSAPAQMSPILPRSHPRARAAICSMPAWL
jgi:anhydro-N-acetylmuramic acid kinase